MHTSVWVSSFCEAPARPAGGWKWECQGYDEPIQLWAMLYPSFNVETLLEGQLWAPRAPVFCDLYTQLPVSIHLLVLAMQLLMFLYAKTTNPTHPLNLEIR